ncbi:MAG: DUF3365 domain-containing protein [Chitinophagaceae bacterium]|nr:DUF3365 domain-containing protein [Chitinophagaceae bacterium]
MYRVSLFLAAMIILSSCSSNGQKDISAEEKASMMLLGDSISTAMQNVLLQNVSAAIQKGGTDYAVEFCNIKAMPLTDSVGSLYKATVHRLSDKNRNPANAIQTATDSIAWQKIKNTKSATIEQDASGAVHYYKPILIAMPSCIKCHGTQTDILESTQKIIAQKYPNDKATGYRMGELRGMWSISWAKEK